MLLDMEWWSKMRVPIRKVWFGVSKRLRIRKTGLLNLRHDVRTCEYDDVHVLWNLLNKNESGTARSTMRSKRGCNWNICSWAKRSPFFCRSV